MEKINSYNYADQFSLVSKVLCSDSFFHYLMIQSDELRLFMCQYLLGNDSIVETKVENPEQFGNFEKRKKKILDIVACDDQGYYYDIEMQYGKIIENDLIRFQCYASELLNCQEVRGKDYTTVRDVYQLIINAGDAVKDLPYYRHDFEMQDFVHGLKLPECKIHMRVIQLKKIKEVIQMENNISEFDQLMFLFANGQPYPKVKKSQRARLIQELYNRYTNTQEYKIYREEEKYQKYINTKIVEAKQEGEEFGKKEAMLSLIRSMLEKKYHDDGEWLNTYNVSQLEKVHDLLLENISLEEVKQKV